MTTRKYTYWVIRVAAGLVVSYWIVSFYDWIIDVYHSKSVAPLYLASESVFS